jgi:hypothetical protein
MRILIVLALALTLAGCDSDNAMPDTTAGSTAISADGWADAQVAPDTAIKLEDAILTRARELRLASGGS